MIKLISASATDVGLRRTNNEDACLAIPEERLFALSDGMGGAAAGEIASGYFIDTVREVFSGQNRSSEEKVCALVQEAFRLSNQRIISHAAEHPQDEGMGCTGELLTFCSNRYIIGHVGDSRIYLFREGKLRQITKDHSLVQLQVDQGIISAEEAKQHPMKNIILRALGSVPSLSLDIIKGSVLHHDIFLLCSDGLSDMVVDAVIQNTLATTHSLEYKVQNLIESANSVGGRDNITVVLCEVEAT
ncbi:Stp1/IreP family PP2C-type Ser/Thr phosphatase [Geobacter sp.]|uniref:Stp1/IreP family PP2C-type Ser/Thr phosphatase n=1 Tax=Geobacter sp. TaxID=46610 RepID=UPI0027BB1E7F|nr:Stp1/IreP family PP2C-type Ser/Thr phosphatase [Geobacter sp.]